MTRERIACYVLSALATSSAAALGRKVRSHRQIAALLFYGLAADLTNELLAPRAFELRQILVQAYPWAVVAVSATVLGHGRGVLVLPLFSIYIGAVVGSGARGDALARVYACAQAGVSIALVAIVGIWWATMRPSRTTTETCGVFCAAAEIANVPPYLGLPTSWWGARAVYAMLYIALVLTQGGALCSRPAMRSGARSSF